MQNDVCCIGQLIWRTNIVRIAIIGPASPMPGRVLVPVHVDCQRDSRQLLDHDLLDALTVYLCASAPKYTVAGQFRIRTGFPCGDSEHEHTSSAGLSRHPQMLCPGGVTASARR